MYNHSLKPNLADTPETMFYACLKCASLRLGKAEKVLIGEDAEAVSGGWRGPSRHPLSVSGGGDATP